MTPIADMVAALIALGVPTDAIVIAVRTAELVSAQSSGQSADSAANRRAMDRIRKQKSRAMSRFSKNQPEANDAGHGADTSADSVDTCTNDSPSISDSQLEKKAEQKESKRGLVEGRRGSRLAVDWRPTDADRQFARDRGMSAAAIDELVAEFIDYWVGIPGQRGTKLDWSGTFRNRVRQVGTNGTGNRQGRQRNSLVTAADDLIARAESLEREGHGSAADGTGPIIEGSQNPRR